MGSEMCIRDSPLGEGSALTDWSQRGLCLDGGVDRWSVSSDFMVNAMASINSVLEERKEIDRRDMTTVADLVSYWEEHSNRNGEYDNA